ncbi:MAG: hypothetical protein HND47_20010 [Chloroflexi bacterium]|nr:hypothetical protein [Chloroflexota bacterium]
MYYILGDHLGSTSIVTDASGNVVSQTRYKAWGEVRYSSGTSPTDYTFTGQKSYTDSFDLMYYNARWYDPYLNHMTQPDSIVPDPYNSQDYDRYAYARNNPLRYNDPTGHVTCEGTNWDDGPQCVKKNPKAYNRNDPKNYTHFVHYRTIVICGWGTGGNCGNGSPVTGYNNEVPMNPYPADAYFFTENPEVMSGHTKEDVLNQVSDYIKEQQTQDNTLRFILIGHSAGADAAILIADKLGRNAVSRTVLLDPTLSATLNGQIVDLQTQADSVANDIPTLLVDSKEPGVGYKLISGASYQEYGNGSGNVHNQMAVDEHLALQVVFPFLSPLP